MGMDEEIKAFRRIANDLLNMAIEEIGSNVLLAPRTLFSIVISTLRRGSSLSRNEMLLLMKEFLSVLDEKPVRISDKDRNFFLGKNLKKKPREDWKTAEILRGAFGHEKRQPRDAV